MFNTQLTSRENISMLGDVDLEGKSTIKSLFLKGEKGYIIIAMMGVEKAARRIPRFALIELVILENLGV